MNEEFPVDDDGAAPRSWMRWGLWALLALCIGIALLFAATFAGAWLFGQDGLPDEPTILNAGVAEQYARGDVTYFDTDHIYVVRLTDGTFRALYDRSSRSQELRRDCRVDFDEATEPTGTEQLTGFRGAFVEECDGQRTVWRADGELASGAGYGRLDRFATSVDENGDLMVDITQRSCTRSRGVVAVPPFDEQTCGRAE